MQPEPFALFEQWLHAAKNTEIEASAMSLSTCTAAGHPTSRMVLLKQFDDRGLVFYTNLLSPKVQHLRENPRVALCFYWPTLMKQVRVEGLAAQVDDEEADRYFASRSRDRQLGAWASQQSAVLESRQALLQRYREMEEKYAARDVPRPPFWSGFRVRPERFEFWIGDADRLNERILFEREEQGWVKSLLYP